MLPEWADPATLRWLLLGTLLVVAVAAFMVFRFVQKMMMRVALLGILSVLGLSLWVQRAELQDCSRQCSCSLFWQDVQIPDETIAKIPESRRPAGCVLSTESAAR